MGTRTSGHSTDDVRGMIKVGWTPRASDEYTLTYVKQDGNKIVHRIVILMPKVDINIGHGQIIIKRVTTIVV